MGNLKIRGFLPKADADEKGVSRWGFQSRFEELRKQVEQKLPGKK
jgi:hypothetical protein